MLCTITENKQNEKQSNTIPACAPPPSLSQSCRAVYADIVVLTWSWVPNFVAASGQEAVRKQRWRGTTTMTTMTITFPKQKLVVKPFIICCVLYFFNASLLLCISISTTFTECKRSFCVEIRPAKCCDIHGHKKREYFLVGPFLPKYQVLPFLRLGVTGKSWIKICTSSVCHTTATTCGMRHNTKQAEWKTKRRYPLSVPCRRCCAIPVVPFPPPLSRRDVHESPTLSLPAAKRLGGNTGSEEWLQWWRWQWNLRSHAGSSVMAVLLSPRHPRYHRRSLMTVSPCKHRHLGLRGREEAAVLGDNNDDNNSDNNEIYADTQDHPLLAPIVVANLTVDCCWGGWRGGGHEFPRPINPVGEGGHRGAEVAEGKEPRNGGARERDRITAEREWQDSIT